MRYTPTLLPKRLKPGEWPYYGISPERTQQQLTEGYKSKKSEMKRLICWVLVVRRKEVIAYDTIGGRELYLGRRESKAC